MYTLGFVLEEIDHAFEEKELVFLEFGLGFKLLIDAGKLPHSDFQVGLVKPLGVLTQVIKFGQIDVVCAVVVLQFLDIEEHLLHPTVGVIFT